MQKLSGGRAGTYNNAGEMGEQHPVALVIATVNLSEVCLEVRYYCIVLICPIAIGGDAVMDSAPRSI